MMSLAPAALLGFLVGLRHATDADHVAAVSAIVARERTLRGAAFIGAAWGLGHTITLLLLGGGIIVFGLAVPRPVALGLELAVGVMLIGLGVWNFLSRRQHRNASSAQAHPERSPRRALRPLAVGSMHGLAGSAAAALLVVATVQKPTWGILYLLIFGIGTMLGMTVLTTVLALPLSGALRRFRRAEAWLRVGSGALSVAIGAFVVYEIGFRSGLFLQ
jgi:cytochrome c biogenesis protein CcdA